jgi:YD repeat-containing protein
MFAKNTASSTTAGQRDDKLDRSYDYDQVGRLTVSHTGYEARLHMNRQGAGDSTNYGAYSQVYSYDQWGNMTSRAGWGGFNPSASYSYTNNRNNSLQYDAAGNVTNDGQAFTYDAAGRQVTSVYAPNNWNIQQSYDGNGLRVKKMEGSNTTYYLRSSVLGEQVVAELDQYSNWTRGYVYLGGQLLAIQQGSSNTVSWVHQDPITKSQRVTASNGSVTATIDLDPVLGLM